MSRPTPRAVTGTELLHDPAAESLDDALGGCGQPDCDALPPGMAACREDRRPCATESCNDCRHRAKLVFGSYAQEPTR